MIKSTVILGEQAVAHFNETGTVPSEQWLMENGGVVDYVEFDTIAEFDAYNRALSDSDGWYDYHVIKHSETPDDNQPAKELWAFTYPADEMARNTSDADIVAAYEHEDNDCREYPVEKLTPDEFACRINDEAFADVKYWVRFITI